jgi:hypothetical protein
VTFFFAVHDHNIGTDATIRAFDYGAVPQPGPYPYSFGEIDNKIRHSETLLIPVSV